jgi:hypothetical protein
MRLMRNLALLGIARRVYTEARKPENQRRIQEAVASFQARRGGAAGAGGRTRR